MRKANSFSTVMLTVSITAMVMFGFAFAAKGGNGKGKGQGPGGGDTIQDTGPGSGGGGSSVTISAPDGTFATYTTITVSGESDANRVLVECFQQGGVVYRAYKGISSTGGAMFLLGPTELWTGGDADCSAEAGYWTSSAQWRGVVSTTFVTFDSD